MVLTREELQSLVEVRQRSPHHLLGLHPLGDGSGLVARALAPKADKVELQPVGDVAREADRREIASDDYSAIGLNRDGANGAIGIGVESIEGALSK